MFAGAGKTYTMLGAHDEPGIMAQALNDLFLEMERTSEDMSYRVTMSYLEVRVHLVLRGEIFALFFLSF